MYAHDLKQSSFKITDFDQASCPTFFTMLGSNKVSTKFQSKNNQILLFRHFHMVNDSKRDFFGGNKKDKNEDAKKADEEKLKKMQE